MRAPLLIPVVLIACVALSQTSRRAPETASAEPATIAGAVFRADGTPMKNVIVEAIGQNLSAGTATSFTAVSGSDGKFLIQAVDPGTYSLQALRPNYLPVKYGARRPGDPGVQFAARAAEHLTGFDFHLQPAAVISGHVIDEDGESIVGVSVTAFRWGFRNGHRDLLPVASALTDDRGEYRIHQLPPGRYYINALVAPGGSTVIAQMRTVERRTTGRLPYVPAFFPAATEVAGAAEVPVALGDQITNIDVRLMSGTGVRLTGWVHTSGGQQAHQVPVLLYPRDRDVAFGSPRTTTTDANGYFVFENVLPGEYTLAATGSDTGYAGREPRPAMARVDVQINNLDVKDVVLPLSPATSIIAVLRLDPADVARVAAGRKFASFTLEPQDPISRRVTAGAVMTSAQTFINFFNVVDGDYTLDATTLPDGTYVSALRAGGRDSSDTNQFSLRNGRVTQIEIVIGSDAGQISGTVVDAEDHPFAGARVVLVPDESRRKRLDLYKTSVADRTGAFTFRNVMPGTYELFAWESVEEGAWLNADFLAAAERTGASIEVKPRDTATATLRVIPADVR